MNLELNNRVALVTGGSKGIGRAVARALASEGAQIAICARDEASLKQVAQDIRALWHTNVLSIAADLNHLSDITRVVEATVARFGRIDILVNNAGAIRGGGFLTTPDDQWMKDWELKLLGYIRMCRAVFPVMQAQLDGRIVNVAGTAARNPAESYLAGGAANAALINFTKGLADLGAKSNILVNAVSPGPTSTDRWVSLLQQQPLSAGKPVELMRAEIEKANPLGRIATP